MLGRLVLAAVTGMSGILALGPALAQTADGSTPAVETVCDSQVGAAFGLCNAYCEAMDCDSLNPQASETACANVFGRFENITGNPPPCENICPCQFRERLDADFETDRVWQCFETDTGVSVSTSIQHSFSPPPADGASVNFATGGTGVCNFSITSADGTFDVVRIFRLTLEEANACAEQIRTFAAVHEGDFPGNNNQCFLPLQ